MRNVRNLIQGSDEWHQFRAEHFGASEAAAMLGISPYRTRLDLLKEKAIGLTQEVSPAQQRIFDNGHAVEGPARQIAEEVIGEELFPSTYELDRLSASCDGITFAGDIAWEHKQYNASLAQSLRDGVLPEHHQPQAQQVMLVTGAKKLLFTCSNGTPEQCVHLWVYPSNEWQDRLRKGWEQFAHDLAAYEHVEVMPAAVGRAPDQLPALHIEVTGAVTASNLESFKAHALAVFEGIRTDLVTDADFADAEKTVKWCKEVEDKLDAAKNHALSQTATIDELFRAIDSIREEARQKRLTLDKLVKTRKESIRAELVRDAQLLLAVHYTQLEKRVGGAWLIPPVNPFAECVKGKKSITGIEDALNAELAKQKIWATEIADRIDANRKATGEHWHLFQHDFSRVCTLEAEVFTSLLNQRIAEEQQRPAAERQRAEAKAAAEQQAALARQAEEERIKQEAADKAAQQAQREAEAAAAREAAADAVIAQAITPPETVKHEAVIEAEDDIREFLRTRDFGKEHSRIRGILIEYSKFVAMRGMRQAA